MWQEPMIEIGQRAGACGHWRWMPGMLVQLDRGPCRVFSVQSDGWIGLAEEHSRGTPLYSKLTANIPDFTDPATVGCLLAIVRESKRDRWICPQYVILAADHEEWQCCDESGKSEAECLVAVLETL